MAPPSVDNCGEATPRSKHQFFLVRKVCTDFFGNPGHLLLGYTGNDLAGNMRQIETKQDSIDCQSDPEARWRILYRSDV